MTNRHHLTRAHLYGVFVNYMQYTRELQAPSLAAAERCDLASTLPFDLGWMWQLFEQRKKGGVGGPD